MKLTKKQLIKIIKEEYAIATGTTHGGEKIAEQHDEHEPEQDYVVADWVDAYVKVYGEEPSEYEIMLAYGEDPRKIEQETEALEAEYDYQMGRDGDITEQSDDWRDYVDEEEEEEEIVEQSDNWTDYKVSREDELISIISDTYKDIYGFRPKGMNLDKKSIEELEAIADDLFDQYEEQGGAYDELYADEEPGHPWDPSEEEREFDAERAQADEDDMYDEDELDFDKHGGKIRGSQIQYTND